MKRYKIQNNVDGIPVIFLRAYVYRQQWRRYHMKMEHLGLGLLFWDNAET